MTAIHPFAHAADGGASGAAFGPRPSLPIVPHHAVDIDAAETRRIDRLAARLLEDEPTLDATAPFGAEVTAGLGHAAAVFLEDHSAIRLFETRGNPAYSYRALLLAGEGDLVLVGAARNPAFEDYCRERLGLGRAEVVPVLPAGPPRPLAVACAEDPALLGALTCRAREAGGLDLVPYMGTGGIWRLAGRISRAAGVPVKVAAPPPRLTRRVNDKLWFAERVTELFGAEARPPAHAAFSLAMLAARVAFLAGRNPAVAVKLTDSASSAGNFVLSCEEVAGLGLGALRARLAGLLDRAGWRGGFPLMVTAWEQPVLASPSVQLWVPNRGQGEVVVEGIFDQAVMGLARMFVGAEPTAASLETQRRMSAEAARLGRLFQALGYYGRCSFDAILVGEDEGRARLHWIECNGRWGGTSIPMTLANRLVGDWHRRPFAVIERDDLDVAPRPVSRFLEALEDELYLPGRAAGAVLLSPGQVEQGEGYEIMVLGESRTDLRLRMARLSARLGGAAGGAGAGRRG
jgi:hypothetical protein